MATISASDIKAPVVLPNKLYTPSIKNTEVINKRLYTPNIKNEKKLDLSQQIPIPENSKVDDFISIPKPELISFEVPLYIPDPQNTEVNAYLYIPNPNADEIKVSITLPELLLDSIDIPLFTPEKLKTPWIPKYAYAIPLKRGAEELKEIFAGAFEVNPINYWTIDLSYDGRTNEDYRGLGSEWITQWKEIEKQYTRNNNDFWMTIIPYNIELPKDASGKSVKVSYKIPKLKLPKKYLYKKSYLSYRNVGGDWLWKNTKIMPDPNFVVPEPPASQGWDGKAWEIRGEQFLKEWEEMWSAENWKNIGLEVATDFLSSTIASMFTFGGYDVTSGEGKSGGFEIYEPEKLGYVSYVNNTPPHLFNYLGQPSVVNDPWKPQLQSKFNIVSGSPHPINMLNGIGPDFMKHKFDAYFIFYNEDGTTSYIDLSKEKWMTPFQRFIFDHKGFAVRFGTISIPTVSQDNFSVNWLETQILKPRTVLNTDNKATFSFRMDQNLFWLDFVDKMASHNNTLDKLAIHNAVKSEDDKYENYYLGFRSWKEAIKYVANSFLSKKKIGLVVKMSHLSDIIHTGTQQRLLPYFVFEDIKILGVSESVTYSRESNEILNSSINFIFKFLSEVYVLNKNNDNPNYEFVTNTSTKHSKTWYNIERYKYMFKNLNNYMRFYQKPPPIYTYEEILGVETGGII